MSYFRNKHDEHRAKLLDNHASTVFEFLKDRVLYSNNFPSVVETNVRLENNFTCDEIGKRFVEKYKSELNDVKDISWKNSIIYGRSGHKFDACEFRLSFD